MAMPHLSSIWVTPEHLQRRAGLQGIISYQFSGADKKRNAKMAWRLLFPLIFDGLQHRFGVGSLFESLTKFGFVKNLGDVGERVEMFLELTLGNEEKHDEIYRLIIERVEVDSFLRATQRTDDFGNQIGGGVRDADAESDTGAHGSLSLLDDSGDGLAMLGLDFSCGHEVVDEFINRLPTVGGL